MKKVRNGVFETNSSSTHSICIQKAPVGDVLGKKIYFRIGEYGWGRDCVCTSDYLYTAILEQSEWGEDLEKLKTILDNHGVKYRFEKPQFDEDGWLLNGYIDHCGEVWDFVDAVLSDEDLLLRCLFGKDSCVYTGCDSCQSTDECYSAYDVVYEDDYNYSNMNKIENPNYHPDKFEYFFKGN